MQKKTKSLLDELDQYYLVKDKHQFVESKASHLIQSAINFIHYIKENYSANEAEELERRFLNSIRAQDYSKFSRTVKKLKEQANSK